MEVNLDILISDRCPQHVQSHNINLIFRKLLIYWKNIHRKSNHVADQHSPIQSSYSVMKQVATQQKNGTVLKHIPITLHLFQERKFISSLT